MKKGIKQGDIIKMTWLDAFGRGSWNGVKDVEDGLKNFITVDIVGYFIKEDKNFIVLSMGGQNDPYSTPFLHLEFIPSSCVTKIEKLTK